MLAMIHAAMLLAQTRTGNIPSPALPVNTLLDAASAILQQASRLRSRAQPVSAAKPNPTEVLNAGFATATAIKRRPAAHPLTLATSSETGDGLDELKTEIMALAS